MENKKYLNFSLFIRNMKAEIERVTAQKAEIFFWVIVAPLYMGTTILPYATDAPVIAKIPMRILLGCSVALWVYADSKKFSKISRKKATVYSAMCLLWPEVFSVIYTFSSRGLKGGLISSSKCLGYTFAVGAIVMLIKDFILA